MLHTTVNLIQHVWGMGCADCIGILFQNANVVCFSTFSSILILSFPVLNLKQDVSTSVLMVLEVDCNDFCVREDLRECCWWQLGKLLLGW
jgi:hypothetical protein